MRRAVAALTLALVACRPEAAATEIVVTVDTPLGVPCTIDTLRIEATGGGDPASEEIALAAADLPGSFTLVPGGDPEDVTVTVTGLRLGEPLAVAQQEVTFAEETSLELRFVLDRACIPGPCPAVGVGGFYGLPEALPRRGCGAERYARVDSTIAMRDACDMDDTIVSRMFTAGVDEDEQPSPLSPAMPFPFRFYGEVVNDLWIGTNGYLGLGAQPPRGLAADGAARSLGDTGTLAGPAIAAFWDNLRTGARGVCLAVTGQAPDRILWVTWKEACFAAANQACGAAAQGRLTFTLALEETTDRIYVGYQDMVAAAPNDDRAKGLTAVVGITAAAPKACPASACSAEGLCGDGAACGYNEVSALTLLDPLPAVELQPR